MARKIGQIIARGKRRWLVRVYLGRDRETRKRIYHSALCHIQFTDYQDVVPDHKNPKGMGGAWRDDHPDNIQATHWWCNEDKGSSRTDE